MTERAVPDRLREPAASPARRCPRHHSDVEALHGARNSRVIWLLLAASFVVILNETIMGVAIPHLVIDLGITIEAAQWLTTAFMLTMAVVIPITGFLLQRFATRPIFIAAMSLFSTGTLIAALAPGFEVLLLARVVQASGTAIMMPLLMTTLMTLVAPADRGRFMGRVSIVMSVAPAIGPTISGLILRSSRGGSCSGSCCRSRSRCSSSASAASRTSASRAKIPIDVFSVVLSAFGFGGLVYGLSLVGGEAAGTRSPAPMWISFGVGAVAIAAFILRQLSLQRHDRALLDLRTFRSRNFAISVGAHGHHDGGAVRHDHPAADLPAERAAPRARHDRPPAAARRPHDGPARADRRSAVRPVRADRAARARRIVVSGVLWSLTMVTETTSPWLLLVAHIVLSAGLAFMFTPLFTSALGSVEPQLYSHGSAIVGTVQQVAGAAGTALFVTIMAAGTAVAGDRRDGRGRAARHPHGVHGGRDPLAVRDRRRVLRAQARRHDGGRRRRGRVAPS